MLMQEIFHQDYFPIYDTDELSFLWKINLLDTLVEYSMLMQVFGKVDSSCCSSWCFSRVPQRIVITMKCMTNRYLYMYHFFKSLSN